MAVTVAVAAAVATANLAVMQYTPPFELFVLVPPRYGQQPLILRVDASATIASVKEKIHKKQATFSIGRQRLLLESSNETLGNGATLASLGLGNQEYPTLQLQLADPPAAPSVLEATIASVMAPARQAAETAAATRLQAATRRIFARRELEWRKKAHRLLILCARAEERAAEVIGARSRTWHARAQAVARRRHQAEQEAAEAADAAADAAEAIEDEHRRTQAARQILNAWRRRRALRLAAQARRLESLALTPVSAPVAAAAAALTASSGLDVFSSPHASGALAGGPIGLIHVQARKVTLSRYQFVAWRQRYAFATDSAFCHQRVRSRMVGKRALAAVSGGTPDLYSLLSGKLMPVGDVSEIRFAKIRRVGVQADDPLVLVLDTLDGNQHFLRFATVPHCEEWAAALCAAAAHAGSQ